MCYRNCYDQEIWPTKKQEFIAKAQAFRQGTSRKDQLVSDLLVAGISEQGAEMLVGITALDWEGWEDAGRITWATSDKREAAYAARERYYNNSEDAARAYNDEIKDLYAKEAGE